MKTQNTYTLATTRMDLKLKRINEQEFILISAFIRARDKAERTEDEMMDYYQSKFSDKINAATTKRELTDIKENLRSMPESLSKTLLFRRIIMKEDELNIK